MLAFTIIHPSGSKDAQTLHLVVATCAGVYVVPSRPLRAANQVRIAPENVEPG